MVEVSVEVRPACNWLCSNARASRADWREAAKSSAQGEGGLGVDGRGLLWVKGEGQVQEIFRDVVRSHGALLA